MDGFDDLPLTKGERERERTVSLGVMQRRRSSGVGGTTIKPTPAQRRTGSAGSGSKEGGSTIKAKVGAGKVVPAHATLAPPSASSSSKRAKAESAEEGIEKKPKVVGGGVKEDKTSGRKKKREPQLIRNLGAPVVAKGTRLLSVSCPLARGG